MNRFSIALLICAAGTLAAPAVATQSEPAAAEPAVRVAPEVAPPPAGMGQIVFYRPGSMGGLVSCRVSEGDKVVNRLHPGHYFVQATTPGIHEYSVHSEAKDTLRVNVEEGETQYARCNITMGFLTGRPNLSTQDRADFNKRGKKLKLEPAFDPNAKEDKKEVVKEGDKDDKGAAKN
jgi:hypothetical protein